MSLQACRTALFLLLMVPHAIRAQNRAATQTQNMGYDPASMTTTWGEIHRAQLGTNQRVTIAIGSGSLRVVTGNRDSVTYMAVGPKPSGPKPRIVWRIDSTTGGGFIVQRSDESDSSYMRFLVNVPPNLKELNLRIHGHGVITVMGFQGTLTVSNQNGTVILEEVGGPVLADARNGEIRATITRMPAPGSAGLEFLVNNGNAIVTLPWDASGNLTAGANRGSIFSDFLGAQQVDAGMQNTLWPRQLRMESQPILNTDLGRRPGPPIRISTINGSIILLKGSPPTRP